MEVTGNRRNTMTEQLFDTKWRHYERSIADRIEVGDCWEWTGYRDTAGYGKVGINGVTQLIHRVVWEALVGPIPAGLDLDHLCRNPKCCNPDHLEPVTPGENTNRNYASMIARKRRQTHCKRGKHPLSGDNLYVNTTTGSRQCKTCQSESHKMWRARNAK